MTSFTVHQLQFTVQTETTIQLDTFKGSALRGAWQGHLRTLYCAQNESADLMHQSLCPVCYLLSRDTGSGDDRRPYSFIPPVSDQTRFEPGERFEFGINVFGSAAQFIPYIVLAVGQMGQGQGLGKAIHFSSNKKQWPDQRGKFRLMRIEAINPTIATPQTVLAEGTSTVQMPAVPVTHAQISTLVAQQLPYIQQNGNRLSLTFHTPTRIIQNGKLAHQPHFEPLFARLLSRLTALQQQYAGEPGISREEREQLVELAGRVELVNDQTHWWDLQGHSSRLHRSQQMGGFIGTADYYLAEPSGWANLLTWLWWGTVVQVGKNTVKGEGSYSLKIGGE